MSRLQIISSKPRSRKRGIKSKHEKFIRGFKSALIAKIDSIAKDVHESEKIEQTPSLLSPALRRLKRNVRNGKRPLQVTKNYSESITFLKEKIRSAVDLTDIYKLLIDFQDFHIHSEIVGGEKVWFTCRLPEGLCVSLYEMIEEFISKNFQNQYEALWNTALITRSRQEWIDLLQMQEEKIKGQRDQFRFYWTIFKRFVEFFSPKPTPSMNWVEKLVFQSEYQIRTYIASAVFKGERNDEKSSQVDKWHIADWLWEKCKAFRIKIKVHCTEEELIDIINREWLSIQLFGKSLIEITSIENFVRTHFFCKPYAHETKIYPFKIEVTRASDFIQYMRYFKEHRKFFDLEFDHEVRLMEEVQKIEIQLWLEYLFFDVTGFSEESIESYFIRNKIRQKDLLKFKLAYSRFSLPLEIKSKSIGDSYKDSVTVKAQGRQS